MSPFCNSSPRVAMCHRLGGWFRAFAHFVTGRRGAAAAIDSGMCLVVALGRHDSLWAHVLASMQVAPIAAKVSQVPQSTQAMLEAKALGLAQVGSGSF